MVLLVLACAILACALQEKRWMAEARSRTRRPVLLLHHLAAVLTLPAQARKASGVGARRQAQRLALAQRLLDPLPQGLQAAASGERFWRMLRWGGAGMLVARLLQH